MLETQATAAQEVEPKVVEGVVSILGYQDDGEWVALALEMDLRGYGETWDDATRELRDLVLTQISFALSKGEPEMIWRDAEQEYWERFREAQRARLITQPEDLPELHAGSLRIPPLHEFTAQADRFSPANG